MANLNISIPAIDEHFYTPVAAKANLDKITSVIRPKYGKMIDNISSLTELPSSLIEAFAFIESGGNPIAQSPWAVGILQLSTASASDTLVFEKGAGRLQDGEAKILKKYLGDRYKFIEGVKPKQTSLGKTFVTVNDLKQVEFCLLVGSILIKQLMDEFSNDKLALAKTVIIYNGGRFSKYGKMAIKFNGTIEDLIKNVPKESSDYVRKLLGINGLLDVLV